MRMQSLLPWRKETEMEPLTSLRAAMNSLFDQFFQGGWEERSLPLLSEGTYLPTIDLCEDEDRFILTAELPGIDRKDLELTLTGDRITLKGEKKLANEEKKRDFYRSERSYGSFRRTIPLPPDADWEKAAATFADGVLTVSLPKTAAALKPARKLEIKAA